MAVRESKQSRTKSAAPEISSVASDQSPNTKHRLALILAAVDEGYWDWNISTGEITYGEGWLASLGYSQSDISRDLSFWESIIHPDDQPEFDSNLRAHLTGERPDFDVECRLRTRSGHYLWFRNHGKIVGRAKSGRPVRMVGTIVDVDPRRRAQSQLAASQVELAALIESTDDLVWSVNPTDFRLISFNSTFRNLVSKVHGIDLRPGMSSDDMVPPDRVEFWKNFYRRVLEVGKGDCDYQLSPGDDTFHIISRLLLRDGQVFAISIFGHNITERKRIEEELRKSEEKFAKAFMQSPMAVTLTSTRDQRYLEVNEAFLQATGYQRHEVIGRTRLDLGIWASSEEWVKLVELLLAAGEVRNVEVHFRTKGGEIRDALGSAALIDIDGEPCLISAVADVTDRKRADNALRDSEERLRLAIESGRMYAFEWDPKSDLIVRSRESSSILDLGSFNAPQSKQEFIQTIHPEDRPDYLNVVQSLSPEHASYRIIFRLPRPNQNTVWLEESGHAFFDSAGVMYRVIGMTADVTEARQAERALRELSGRLINSQEEERRRIARELHDNIGQELALLAVQARRVDSGVSAEEQTTHLDVHELYRRIKEIATKVSTLSHRLHSSELDFLGLGVAAERLCHDFAKQYGLDTDYEITGVSRKLDSGISLCFYRTLQEALQNVAKHSKATRVVVELRGSPKALTLKVSDNGIGFSVGKAQSESGLGLVSIRERMYLIGGKVTISSKLEHGSTLQAWVAVSCEMA